MNDSVTTNDRSELLHRPLLLIEEFSKIFSFVFQGGYPAKLKKVLIVTAPLWFKAPFKILRLFVREKLRERVYTVSAAQLLQHIPKDSLPEKLGGTLRVDHDGWLERCLHLAMTARTESPQPNYGKKRNRLKVYSAIFTNFFFRW